MSIVLYIYLSNIQKKKKKNLSHVLPLGGLFLMGLSSALSSPRSEQVSGQNRGGVGGKVGSDGSKPNNG